MSVSEAGSQPLRLVAERDEVCRHELAAGTCAICKMDDRPSVYVSGGGGRYHARPDCPSLLEGQGLVEERAGATEPIERVHPGSARLEGRIPCRTCRPA